MFQSETTKSNGLAAQFVQGIHAVLGFLHVGKPELLKEISHDAPHRGEIVHHQKFCIFNAHYFLLKTVLSAKDL